MSILQRALIAKSGYDCGFEHVTAETDAGLRLASARHPAVLDVSLDGTGYIVSVIKGNASLAAELQRHFPAEQGRFPCQTEHGGYLDYHRGRYIEAAARIC